MTKQELVTRAIEILEENDDVFVDAVNELDSYSGFAESFRCWDMYELDELYGGMSPTDLLNEVCSDFAIGDDYFYADCYGIHSTDYPVDVYRNNADAGEVLDNLVDDYNSIEINHHELDEIVEALANEDYSDDSEDSFEWTDEE